MTSQRPPQTAPGRALTLSRLKALVNPQLTVVVPVDGDRIVEIDRPIPLHVFRLIKYLRRPVLIFV